MDAFFRFLQSTRQDTEGRGGEMSESELEKQRALLLAKLNEIYVKSSMEKWQMFRRSILNVYYSALPTSQVCKNEVTNFTPLYPKLKNCLHGACNFKIPRIVMNTIENMPNAF
ncbi:hypothetical protein NQ317_005069 [Molorchus minor]|uniref:Uncharacterized protein n=1 Tax=Molorchus minor TaxID=1323400 RepID=A0ABQ9JZ43_9CUCU|nr:hypothetical protein NQ317_005069 [Molorchus minor]